MGASMARTCTSVTGIDPDEYERYKKEHAEQLERITQLEQELHTKSEVEAQHKQSQSLVAELTAQLDDKKAAIAKEQEENQAEIARMEQELADKQSLQRSNTEKDSQLADLVKQLEEKKAKVSEQELSEAAQIALLEKHLLEKKRLEKEHEELLKLHEKKTRELTEQTQLHQRRASELAQQLEEKEHAVKEKDNVIREKSNSLAMTEAQASELRFKLQVEQETRERIEKELERMQEELKANAESVAAPVARKIFGVNIDAVPTLKVTQYNAPIPQILLDLRAYIDQNKILEKKGVFRIPPSQKQLVAAREEIESGKFPHMQDHNVAPALITLYFRELPSMILGDLKLKDVKNAAKSNDKAWKLVKKMKEPQASVFLWLLDLCCDTAKLTAYNSMNIDGIAKVMAPNLYKVDIHLGLTPDESRAVLESAMVWATFLRQVITYRMDNPIS